MFREAFAIGDDMGQAQGSQFQQQVLKTMQHLMRDMTVALYSDIGQI